MAHIRVDRLAARDAERHRSEDDEAGSTVPREETERVPRIDGNENLRVSEDPISTHGGDHREPDEHRGPEDSSDPGRTAPLEEKEQDEDDRRDRDHDRSREEALLADREPLDGAQ